MIIKQDQTAARADAIKAAHAATFAASERCMALRRQITDAMQRYEEAQQSLDRLLSPRYQRYEGEVRAKAITLAEEEVRHHIASIQRLADERIDAARAAGEAEEQVSRVAWHHV